jgi:hypothetical protein
MVYRRHALFWTRNRTTPKGPPPLQAEPSKLTVLGWLLTTWGGKRQLVIARINMDFLSCANVHFLLLFFLLLLLPLDFTFRSCLLL